MASLSTGELAKIFRMIKYPTQDKLTHSQKVCRLYRKALKLSYPMQWGSIYNMPLMSLWTHPGRATIHVREAFRQRKIETDPRLINQYIIEAEEFCAKWTRSEPAAPLYERGGALYQRNAALPPELLKPEAHVDFEALNKLESESDYYIARYKESQHKAIEEKFKQGSNQL